MAVYGQDNPAPKGDSDQPAMGGGMENGGPGGGMMGEGRVDQWKEKLGLSDEQVSKLKDLFKSQMDIMKPLRDQMKIDMDTLQQKVDAKASDADLKKVLGTLSADRKNLDSARQKMEDQVRGILTPTQQAKFVLGLNNKGKQMMKKMWNQRHGKGKGPGNDSGNPPSDSNAPGPSGNAGGDSQ